MKSLSKTTMASVLFAAAIFLAGMSFWTTDENADKNMLDDMEIAHIAYTAGTIDISYAHLALAFSQDPAIREFAETMIRDHTAVNDKAIALLQELNATPKNNATSQKLLADAAKFKKELIKLDGKAFDRRYAENELNYHRFVNKTVESQFIPAVQNNQFKSLLRSALRTFKVHERHAERMNNQLSR